MNYNWRSQYNNKHTYKYKKESYKKSGNMLQHFICINQSIHLSQCTISDVVKASCEAQVSTKQVNVHIR